MEDCLQEQTKHSESSSYLLLDIHPNASRDAISTRDGRHMRSRRAKAIQKLIAVLSKVLREPAGDAFLPAA